MLGHIFSHFFSIFICFNFFSLFFVFIDSWTNTLSTTIEFASYDHCISMRMCCFVRFSFIPQKSDEILWERLFFLSQWLIVHAIWILRSIDHKMIVLIWWEMSVKWNWPCSIFKLQLQLYILLIINSQPIFSACIVKGWKISKFWPDTKTNTCLLVTGKAFGRRLENYGI